MASITFRSNPVACSSSLARFPAGRHHTVGADTPPRSPPGPARPSPAPLPFPRSPSPRSPGTPRWRTGTARADAAGRSRRAALTRSNLEAMAARLAALPAREEAEVTSAGRGSRAPLAGAPPSATPTPAEPRPRAWPHPSVTPSAPGARRSPWAGGEAEIWDGRWDPPWEQGQPSGGQGPCSGGDGDGTPLGLEGRRGYYGRVTPWGTGMMSLGPWGWDTPEGMETDASGALGTQHPGVTGTGSLKTWGQDQLRTLQSAIPAAMGTDGHGGKMTPLRA